MDRYGYQIAIERRYLRASDADREPRTGTIGLISPLEGNFNEHNKGACPASAKFIRLPHGRASVGEKQVRLTLRIDVDETDIVPADVLLDESRQASDFVDRVFDIPLC